MASAEKQKSSMLKCVGSLKGARSSQRPDHHALPTELSNLSHQQAKDLNTEEFKQQGMGTISSDKRNCILKRSFGLLWKKEERT